MATVLYASSRLQDVDELTKIRALIGAKYGKDFVARCVGNDEAAIAAGVNSRVIQLLAARAPDTLDIR